MFFSQDLDVVGLLGKYCTWEEEEGGGDGECMPSKTLVWELAVYRWDQVTFCFLLQLRTKNRLRFCTYERALLVVYLWFHAPRRHNRYEGGGDAVYIVREQCALFSCLDCTRWYFLIMVAND